MLNVVINKLLVDSHNMIQNKLGKSILNVLKEWKKEIKKSKIDPLCEYKYLSILIIKYYQWNFTYAQVLKDIKAWLFYS